ncbi:hypothetical protein M378DRAFT_79034, partial [Amanita muscaria Koide BX008]
NIFDNLPSLAKPKLSHLRDELAIYLSTDVEDITNPIAWWLERRSLYPRLSRMALDYLTIPATSVDVERLFSRGRILLSHLRNRMSAQTTRALLCLGDWSLLDLIKNEDVRKVVELEDVHGHEEEDDIELPDGWDSISLA